MAAVEKIEVITIPIEKQSIESRNRQRIGLLKVLKSSGYAPGSKSYNGLQGAIEK